MLSRNWIFAHRPPIMTAIIILFAWWPAMANTLADQHGDHAASAPANAAIALRILSAEARAQGIEILNVAVSPNADAESQALYIPTYSANTRVLEFSIDNTSGSPRSLALAFETARISQLHCTTKSSKHAEHRQLVAGARLPLSEWTSPARRPVLFLDVGPQASMRVSCEFESEVIYAPHPRLYDLRAYEALEDRSALINGILLGGLLAMAWACALIAGFARSAPFGMLALACLSVAVYEAALLGYGQFYLWPEMAAWNYRSVTILGLCNGLCVLALVYLLIRRHARSLRLTPWFSCLCAAYGLAFIGSLIGPIAWASKAAVLLGVLFFLTMLGLAIVSLRHRTPGAIWIVLATGYGLLNFLIASPGGIEDFAPYLQGVSLGMEPNPVLALGGMFAYLSILAAWVHALNSERDKATRSLLKWRENEQSRLKQEVELKTSQLAQSLVYAQEKHEKLVFVMGYVAHDLRAPLSVVSQYLNASNLADEQEIDRLVSVVNDNINYLLALIDDLLLYSRSEISPLDVHPAPVKLGIFFRKISDQARILAKKNGNSYVERYAPSFEIEAMLDATRLSQLLINLLSNSASYCFEEEVRFELHARHEEAENWTLTFIVADTGEGISPSDEPRIFDIFYQKEETASTGGLGLFIAKNISEKMGGSLLMKGQPGEGARFEFQITVRALIMAETEPLAIDMTTDAEAPEPIHELYKLSSAVRAWLADLADTGAITELEAALDILTELHPELSNALTRLKQDVEGLHFSRISRMRHEDAAQAAPFRDPLRVSTAETRV